VRLATPTGITPPLVLGVDRLPQQPIAETISALPVAMSGALGGGQIIRSSFAGKQGQPIVVELEAQRLGANFKPVVRLYDSRGKQLAYSPPRAPVGGDARVAVTLPADGTYTIELHDLLYRAAGPGFFRLKVGELSYADFAWPQAITRGTKAVVRMTASNLPAEATAEVDASQNTWRGRRAGAAPATPLFSGGVPGMLITDGSEVAETPVADGQKQMLSAVPCGVTGQIQAKGEEDQYLVPVTAGQKLRVDVTARRIGSMLDGVLIIRGPQGNELARNDDMPGTADPGLDFTVPAGVDKLFVCVRDMQNRFSSEHIYHLGIRDASAPDVAATIGVDTIHVPVGSATLLPVTITRTNYAGPLRIEAIGTVGDVRLDGAEVPAGATSALLTIAAKGGYPVHSTLRLVVRATEPNVDLVRNIQGPDTSGATRRQPWLREEFGFAVVESGPLSIAWNTAVERRIAFRGDKLPLHLNVTRKAGVTGDLRLRLVSTQPTPKKKIKENNQDKEVDDLDRTLRIAGGMPIFKPDATAIAADLLIPGDLPAQAWDYVVVAELLSTDGKNVVALANTSAERLVAETPFTLELTSTPQAEGKAGLGETGKFTGKIVRAAGFTQPVILTLKGLPADVKMVPQATVAADATEFTLPLAFEYGSKQGEFKGVKLAASVMGDLQPVATADVEIKIVAGEKPQ
jgi:hypothetical protein